MAQYRNQHYVQRAYLRGFGAPLVPDAWKKTGAIWVLEKSTGRIHLQSIERTAARKYYYSFRDKNGEINPLIEKWFHPVEEGFISVRQELQDNIQQINLIGTPAWVDPEIRRLLAHFAFIHMIRVPKMFEMIRRESVAFHKKLRRSMVCPMIPIRLR